MRRDMRARKCPRQIKPAARAVEVNAFPNAAKPRKTAATQGLRVESAQRNTAPRDHRAGPSLGVGNGNGKFCERRGKCVEVATGRAAGSGGGESAGVA